MPTVHVVALDAPGSAGGFDWTPDEAEAIALEATYLAWSDVQSGECALARFTVDVPDGLSRDETTDMIDVALWVGEYDVQLWPFGRPDPYPDTRPA